MSVYELLDHIRMRTELYIGYSSPTHLHSFLLGYSNAEGFKEIKREQPIFHGFHDWVAGKFGYYESTSGWAHMIEDQREDRREALYLFYELLDEYRGIRREEIAGVKFDHDEAIDTSWTGYSRSKKVQGTFKAIPKPLPKELIIRRVELTQTWFQLVAKNDKQEILFLWDSVELSKVYTRAKQIFGVEADEWILNTKSEPNND